MKKIVPISLNEYYEYYYDFNRNNDNPLNSLGIGRKKLIEDWLREAKIKNYVINIDLTIDVHDHVDIDDMNLIKFPDYIKFNNVYGIFTCDRNNLISLKGCPKYVQSGFYCCGNQLTSLEGCPEIVNGDFWCIENEVLFSIKDVKKLCTVKDRIFV